VTVQRGQRIGAAVLLGCTAAAMAWTMRGEPVAAVGVPADGFVVIASTGGFNPPVTVLGSGTVGYSWGGTVATCTDNDGLPQLAACSWSSQVNFTPTACMTGIAEAPLTSTQVTSATDTDAYSLTIVLVAGLGVAAGSMHEDGGGITASVAGVAILTPQLGEECIDGVKDFSGMIALQTTTPEILPSPYPT